MKKPSITNQITELSQQLVNLQREAGVSNYQLARNQFPMNRLVLAALVLYNPKKAKFRANGLTRREISALITNLGQRSTLSQISIALHQLKSQGVINGGYVRSELGDSGKEYVWNLA